MADNGRVRTLLIDDNELSRTMLRFILSSAVHYEVVGEAGSAADGLAMMETLRPQLVFLDLMVPDMHGIDVLKQIKLQWPETVVVMVAGINDPATTPNVEPGGADAYVVKPFDPAALLETVAQVLAEDGPAPNGKA